jgi:hypothetical protein
MSQLFVVKGFTESLKKMPDDGYVDPKIFS